MTTNARVWLKGIVAVVVILLLAYFITGYAGKSSRIRVTVDNTSDYDIDAYARLNTSNMPYFINSGIYTIPAHSKLAISTWYVHAGSHELCVAWAQANASDSGPDAYFVYPTHYMMPYTTWNVVVNVTVGPY